MASSELYAGEPIINDSTPESDHEPPPGQSRGLELPLSHNPAGGNYGDLAASFPQELLIPRSEWQARIQEKEERKNRVSDELIRRGIKCKDQNGTNYCWINAPTHCIEIARAFQNQEYVELSPASVGSKIKGFRNDGGWGQEGLEYIAAHGVVPVSLWPANAINRQYDKPEAWTEADKFKATEWMELKPRTIDEMVSCWLRDIPTANGYNWWSHEVTGCDPIWLDGDIAGRLRNSWGMGYGSQGFFVLQGRKLIPDDCVAPRVVMGG